MSSALSPRVVSCPGCGELVRWAPESTHRPFCSARCRGIDLGAWASEAYRVPVQQPGEPDPSGSDL